MGNYNKVQSVDRAILILKCFSKRRKEMRLTEIADELNLNKSTVHGIMSTLKYHGLIDQDKETQKYRLGIYLMELGEIVLSSIEIRDIAHPIMEEVSKRLNETVHLSKIDHGELIYLDKVESSQSMRIFTNIGARMPAHCTGMGKAILAYTDKEEVDKLLPDDLDPITKYTITEKKELLLQLEDIRKKGYAIDNEESSIGLRCIAAPIFDYKGEVKYALSVSGPTVRITDKTTEGIIKIIMEAVKIISYKLGYKE